MARPGRGTAQLERRRQDYSAERLWKLGARAFLRGGVLRTDDFGKRSHCSRMTESALGKEATIGSKCGDYFNTLRGLLFPATCTNPHPPPKRKFYFYCVYANHNALIPLYITWPLGHCYISFSRWQMTKSRKTARRAHTKCSSSREKWCSTL